MRTTVELPDALVEEARRVAAERGITLQALLEEALRSLIEPPSHQAESFKLKDGSTPSGPLKPGVASDRPAIRDARASKGRLRPEYEGNWPAIRDEIYKGRGT